MTEQKPTTGIPLRILLGGALGLLASGCPSDGDAPATMEATQNVGVVGAESLPLCTDEYFETQAAGCSFRVSDSATGEVLDEGPCDTYDAADYSIGSSGPEREVNSYFPRQREGLDTIRASMGVFPCWAQLATIHEECSPITPGALVGMVEYTPAELGVTLAWGTGRTVNDNRHRAYICAGEERPDTEGIIDGTLDSVTADCRSDERPTVHYTVVGWFEGRNCTDEDVNDAVDIRFEFTAPGE